jgi:subtilisin family serine protease
MSIKEYVVTLKNHSDLENFYIDMETEGGDLYIPNRAVSVANRRPTSRNTHYMLTDDEAETLRNDARVLAVELTPEALGIKPMPMYTQSSIDWNRSGVNNVNSHRNWGLYRCTLASNVSNWGDRISAFNSTSATKSVAGSINITASGKHVDVVIVDGHLDPTHPEFAVNPDGTGGSRVQQYNWFTHNPNVTGTPQSTYTYPPYVDEFDPNRTDDNDHGAHVAGTACGNSQGWARDCNIYNISPYSTNVNPLDSLALYDYIKIAHRNKPVNPLTGRKNPTVVNNSWGYTAAVNIVDISLIIHKGQQYNGPFTSTQLLDYGIRVSGSRAIIPYRYLPLEIDIQDCINEGIIFVGAAGNDSYKIDTVGGADHENYLRANSVNWYYHKGMSPGADATSLCVGAVNANASEEKASFSNCGPRIDVYAPGSFIISSVNSAIGTYDFRNQFKYIDKFSGTSMASPQVCGIVACLLEIYPNYNQTAVNNYIYQISKVGRLTDTFGGYTDLFSLQGSANRFLFYKNERPIEGQVLPKAAVGLRAASGQVYPRPRIYSYGPQSTN